MIHFTIPLSPVSKKNSQQILLNHSSGKPFIMPSKKYKEYEENVGWLIPPKLRNANINIPCEVKCLFYMPTRRKCDLPNLINAIDDILVKYGVFEDDNYTIIESHDGSRIYVDADNPRTEVYISLISETQH